MITKHALYSGAQDGEPLIQLIQPGEMAKTASALVPEVQAFINKLRPDPDCTYALVNAMGYSEYFGSNSNNDWYGHNPHLDINGLMHAPPDWGCDPAMDKARGKKWYYGYPTYHNATVYAHHKNNNPAKLGFGEVLLVMPNERMKRIELVLRVDKGTAALRGRSSILERIQRYERVDVSMGAKVPFDACLAPGTLVRTQGGYQKIEDLKVGDRVYTHQGRYRPVTRTFERIGDDGIQVSAYGVPTTVASSLHPYYVVREEQLRRCGGSANGKRRRCSPDSSGVCTFCAKPIEVIPEWVAAKDLRVGDYLVAHGNGEGAKHEPLARLAGYYAGDGWLIRQRRGKKKDGEHYLVAFGISTEHARPEHEENVLSCINELTKAEPHVYKESYNRKANKVYCYDRELATRLQSIVGEGSSTKVLAEESDLWDEESALAFLSGWCDADGHFDEEAGSVRICSVSRPLVLAGQRLARRIGMRPTVTPAGSQGETSYPNGKPAWFLMLNREDAARLAPLCLKVSPKPNPRAVRSHLVRVGPWVLHPVRKLAALEKERTFYNLSVEDDESYEAEGVLTHNCSVCTDWPTVRRALDSFDPNRHIHPGIAILHWHKRSPIRGISVTRADYCDCMRTQKGQILSSGQKVFVYNDYPRFFDISFVWIGADKTARVMWFLSDSKEPPPKTVSRQAMNPVYAYLKDIIQKSNSMQPAIISAMEKSAGQSLLVKKSEIEKEISAAWVKNLDLHAQAEPDLPGDVLAAAVDRVGAQRTLSSLGGLGIVLRPREFRAVIGRGTADEGDAARALMHGRDFSTECSDVDDTYSIDKGHTSVDLMKSLMPMTPLRSLFTPELGRRLASPAPARRMQLTITLQTAPMRKIAAQYNGYRLSLLEKGASVFPKYTEVWDPDVEMLMKYSGAEMALPLLLGAGPVLHLLSAHFQEKQRQGQQLGTVASFIANNQTFSTMATIGAGLRIAMGVQAVGGLQSAAQKVLGAIKSLAV